MSDQRSAKSSPRRAAMDAAILRNIGKHRPVAASKTISCSAGVSSFFTAFLGVGGSLLVTGLAEIRPHLIARPNALETTPATWRTLLALKGRGVLVFRVWPPHSRSRFHSRLKCNEVTSAIGIASNSGDRQAACSR